LVPPVIFSYALLLEVISRSRNKTLVRLKKESYQVKVVKRFHVMYKTDENIAMNVKEKMPVLEIQPPGEDG
jgi:hypothetical protein